ncbi:hypothetical protein GCM10011575_44000 [Microlunatus endophyticus]|uniref:CHAT domain-containing protein n=2 Tax=Microlunatus endophyticus TaxID=1716077 RepID=A0A917SGD5_9ACTN|nr:hypothetical protein GCM10011575_44000 [Microlunatus endophyticus]
MVARFLEGRSTESAGGRLRQALGDVAGMVTDLERRIGAAQTANDYEDLSQFAGMASAAAERAALPSDMASILNLLSTAVRAYPGLNNDASRRVSSNILGATRDWCIEIGYLTEASITARNRATALLEQRRINSRDLDEVARDLRFSGRYAKAGSLDEKYHLFAQSLYKFRQHEKNPITSAALSKISGDMSQALNSLRGHLSGDIYRGAVAQLAAVEAEIFDTIVREREASLVRKHGADLKDVQKLTHLEGAELADFVRSNPQALGLIDRPDWLPAIPDWTYACIRRNKPARKILDLLDESSNAGNGPFSAFTEDFARKANAELRWRHQTDPNSYRGLIAALGDPEITLYPDDYFLSLTRTFARGRFFLDLLPGLDDVRRARDAYVRVIEESTPSDLARVVRIQENRARFLSCFFVRLGCYQEAFHLLETSRHVLADRTNETAIASDNIASIHVTHDPDATYLVAKIGDSYLASIMEDFRGPALVRKWLALDPGNSGTAILANSGDVRAYNRSLGALDSEFAPLVAEVVNLAGKCDEIRLALGGLHARLPLASLVERTHPRHFNVITLGQRVGQRTSGEPRSIESATVLCAAHSVRGEELRYAHAECKVVSRLLRGAGYRVSLVENATISEAASALDLSDLVHYSGHSYSAPDDPYHSALVLADGNLDVAQIELMRHSAKLVTLSSCESGLVQSPLAEDEFISLGTALIGDHGGASVSSQWRVYDVASFAFFTKFYKSLLGRKELGPEEVYRSIAESQEWLASAPLMDVRQTVSMDTGDSLELPVWMQSLPDESQPFSHIRNWGAYFMTMS